MTIKIYFDTELYYRNLNNQKIQEEIAFIRPSFNYNTHITGFTYLNQYVKELNNIYEKWEKIYFILKSLKQKYNLDFLELKLFKVGHVEEKLSINIDGTEQVIHHMDLSNIKLNFNEKDITLLSNIISEIYTEIKSINGKFPSLIIGDNDGKHNNCITF